jgi:hypothetical protein
MLLSTLSSVCKRARTDHQVRAEDELLCLLLEVREQVRIMSAQLNRIGAQVASIDARVCRMERARPSSVRPTPPAADVPQAFRVALAARAVRLLDLPPELLVLVAAQLAPDDELAATLVCRKVREAVAGTERRKAGARLSTKIGSVFAALSKLQWAVLSCGLPLNGELLNRAARSGQLSQLSWLCSQGCEWEPPTDMNVGKADACSSAAAGGHLVALQWARANGCPWNEQTCESAARGGHLAVLQWARANGCPWDWRTCYAAAWDGHLAVLQWLRATGCPWDLWTCVFAAQGGHLNVLQWARANGYPW